MKLGFISDAHGNLIGLKIALQYLANVNQIFFLGDHVGYFPDVNEVISLLRTKATLSLLGNHDAIMIDRYKVSAEKDDVYKIEQAKKVITHENLEYLNKLESRAEFVVQNKKILLVHGSPNDPLLEY